MKDNLQSVSMDGVQRNLTLDAELSEWLDLEADKLGMTPSTLVETLLDWARAEEITSDLEMLSDPKKAIERHFKDNFQD